MPVPSSLVVIGASATGLTALLRFAGPVPRGLPSPVCVLQHIGSERSLQLDDGAPRLRATAAMAEQDDAAGDRQPETA